MNSRNENTILEALVRRLVADYQPEKVILFGSHATGEHGPDSDIDLLIIKNTKDRFISRWTKAQRIIKGIHTSIPVDTLVMTPKEIRERSSKGDDFINDILLKGRVLYGG